jgi:hypothetical protein
LALLLPLGVLLSLGEFIRDDVGAKCNEIDGAAAVGPVAKRRRGDNEAKEPGAGVPDALPIRGLEPNGLRVRGTEAGVGTDELPRTALPTLMLPEALTEEQPPGDAATATDCGNCVPVSLELLF